MNKLKKSLCYILSSILLMSSVSISYIESVSAFDIPTAFWGVLEGGRALWTALNTGGALNNGVSISSFARSGREDIQKFQTNVIIAYKAFCIYKEKIQLALDHSDWSEDQLNQEASIKGEADAESFKQNAINVNNTTGRISIKDWGYWQEFCKEFSSVAKNGLGGNLGSGQYVAHITNGVNNIDFQLKTNSGENTFNYNGMYFFDKGSYCQYINYRPVSVDYEVGDVPTDRIRIPYVYINLHDWYGSLYATYTFYTADFLRLTGEYITYTYHYQINVDYTNSGLENSVNNLLEHTNFPTCIMEDEDIQKMVPWVSNLNNLKVTAVAGDVPSYAQAIKDSLDSTEVGKAIEEGGSEKKSLVGEGAIPVKKSGLKNNEGVVTGTIGWDIPDTTTLEGAIANPKDEDEEIKATGIIAIPGSEVIGASADDTVIDFPDTVSVAIPDTVDDTKTVSVADVISEQAGEYYPTQFDITQFFPFCIPFDIAYCIQKFSSGHGEPPIIHIPIVYPSALHGVLGESYDVIIDMSDYSILRNIIKAFILIFFLIGLMKITRSLIRG